MAGFRTLDDLEVAGKRVLVRADLNVPMKDGQVSDDTRIRAVAPTLAWLIERRARVAVLSHFGRPKGAVRPAMSLAPVAQPLAEAVSAALGRTVRISFVNDCIGLVAEGAMEALPEGGLVLLENVRFHPGEEANDPAFARQLATLGDVYVNDAFSAAHRAHASTEALAHLLPAAAGLAMAAELTALEQALSDPERPVAAVVGGAKISSKLAVLGHLVSRVDALIIGGGMANTFLNAKGVGVGVSLCERDLADVARDILARAEAAGCRVYLPLDAVVAKEFRPGVATRTVMIDAVANDDMILDIGPATVAEVSACLEQARTLVWNGPMGAFEMPPFDAGTVALARAAAAATRAGKLLSVAGGGDTVAALNAAQVTGAFTHVSTAGGAFLEWLEGKELPGVKALMR
jgi:phosphoglycerate kinase